MITPFRHFVFGLTVFFLVTMFLGLMPNAMAQDNLLQGACGNKKDPQYSSPVCVEARAQVKTNQNPIAGPNGIINTAANIIAIVGGIAAVIIIIISGFVFVTAGGAIPGQRAGDTPNRAAKARTTMIGAVAGLIIIALAWSMVTFITQKVIKS